MAAPTTVEEYLRQIPNPSPCPHSASAAEPPCRDCIERRINTANALRAGQDPASVLPIRPIDATQPTQGQNQQLVGSPQEVAEAQEILQVAAPTLPLGTPQAAVGGDAGLASPSEPPTATPIVTDEVAAQMMWVRSGNDFFSVESFDDQGFLIAGSKPVGRAAEEPAQVTTFEPPPAAAAPNPLVPGMTHTPAQPSPNDPPPQQAPLDALAQLGAQPPAITQTPPPVIDEGLTQRPAAQLELTPEQAQRRAEIEAGTHTSVAPVPVPDPLAAPDSVPRGTPLGTAQERYEPGGVIGYPDGADGVLKLYVEEHIEVGQACEVNPATGKVRVHRGEPAPVVEQVPEPAPAVEAPTSAPDGSVTPPDAGAGSPSTEERPKLHPAGHRDALIKYVKEHWPNVTADKDNVSYVVIDLLASLVVLQQMTGQESVNALMDAAAHATVAAAQQVAPPPATPAQVPQVAPPAPPAPNDAIAAAAAVAAPQAVPPAQATVMCPHNMPATDFSTTPPRSASCITCMQETPGAPPTMSKLRASRFQQAHLQSVCARAMCGNTIEPGQIIGLVDNIGWCCPRCTKPDPVPQA